MYNDFINFDIMDKAIKVTQRNKEDNPRYLSQAAVGQIVKFTENKFPKVWTTPDWTKEYFNRRPDFHQEAGFYPVVVPEYDPRTQYIKASEIYFEKGVFTYPVNNYTAAELEQQARDRENDQAHGVEDGRKVDGEEEARYIFKELRRLKNAGTLTEGQFQGAQNLLFDALLPMTYGLWDVTKTRLGLITPPVNATLLSILNTIKGRIDYYIENGQPEAYYRKK